MSESKYCKRCDRTLSISNFNKNRCTKDGLTFYCKDCISEYGKKYRATPRGFFRSIVGRENYYHRAKVLITQEEFIDWYDKQPKKCIYCSIPEKHAIIWKKLFNHRSTKLSIDRKDSSKDYVLENMVLSCYLCNTIKNNVLSYEEMKYIGQNFIKPKWKEYLLKVRN